MCSCEFSRQVYKKKCSEIQKKTTFSLNFWDKEHWGPVTEKV